MSTWVVIGGGASLAKSDVDRVRGRARVLAVNNAFAIAPFADVVYACDEEWWQHNDEAVRATTRAARWAGDAAAAVRFGTARLALEEGCGAHALPGYAYTGNGNGGYQAIQLARHLGARVIVLLGFDCQHTGGRKHWHEDHPRPMQNPSPERMTKWREAFPALARDLDADSVAIFNCSRETAIACIPRARLDTLL